MLSLSFCWTDLALAQSSVPLDHSFLPKIRNISDQPVILRFDPLDPLNGQVQILWKKGTRTFDGVRFLELPPQAAGYAGVDDLKGVYQGSDEGAAVIVTKLGELIAIGHSLDAVSYKLPELASDEIKRFLVRRPLDPSQQGLFLLVAEQGRGKPDLQFIFSSLGVFKLESPIFSFPAMRIVEESGQFQLVNEEGGSLSSLTKLGVEEEPLAGAELTATDVESLRTLPTDIQTSRATHAGYPTPFPIVRRMGRYVLVKKSPSAFGVVDHLLDDSLIVTVPLRDEIFVLSETSQVLMVDYPTLDIMDAFAKPRFNLVRSYRSQHKCAKILTSGSVTNL